MDLNLLIVPFAFICGGLVSIFIFNYFSKKEKEKENPSKPFCLVELEKTENIESVFEKWMADECLKYEKLSRYKYRIWPKDNSIVDDVYKLRKVLYNINCNFESLIFHKEYQRLLKVKVEIVEK